MAVRLISGNATKLKIYRSAPIPIPSAYIHRFSYSLALFIRQRHSSQPNPTGTMFAKPSMQKRGEGDRGIS